jgi:hypothetical protein
MSSSGRMRRGDAGLDCKCLLMGVGNAQNVPVSAAGRVVPQKRAQGRTFFWGGAEGGTGRRRMPGDS